MAMKHCVASTLLSQDMVREFKHIFYFLKTFYSSIWYGACKYGILSKLHLPLLVEFGCDVVVVFTLFGIAVETVVVDDTVLSRIVENAVNIKAVFKMNVGDSKIIICEIS